MPNDDKQPSIRDSIRAALDEQRGDGDTVSKKVSKGVEGDIDDNSDPLAEGILDGDEIELGSEDDGQKEIKKLAKAPKVEEAELEDKADDPVEGEAEEAETPEVVDKKPAKKTVIAAPDNWKDETEWDRTPAKVRQRIIKREAEVASGIQQYSEKARAFDEYEQVLGPRRQEMARIGVSPVQVINRALEWMDSLAHPDPRAKLHAIGQLARNFGIDLTSLAPKAPTLNADGTEAAEQPGDLPPAVQQRIDALERQNYMLAQHVQGISGNLQSQQDNAAKMYLSEWSKDKTHYTKVMPLMKLFLENGSVPLNADGSLNLDAAYTMAINADPSVRELVRLEEQEKTRKSAAEKAAKDKKAKQLALQKARAANGSLRPGAPDSASASGKKMNGLSVRDTIRHSLKEIQAQS